MDFKVDGRQVGYTEGGTVITRGFNDHRDAVRTLETVAGRMQILHAVDAGFRVTLDGQLPITWSLPQEQAASGPIEYLRRLRADIRDWDSAGDTGFGLPPDAILIYRGLTMRLFGSDHPGSIITTAPAR